MSFRYTDVKKQLGDGDGLLVMHIRSNKQFMVVYEDAYIYKKDHRWQWDDFFTEHYPVEIRPLNTLCKKGGGFVRQPTKMKNPRHDYVAVITETLESYHAFLLHYVNKEGNDLKGIPLWVHTEQDIVGRNFVSVFLVEPFRSIAYLRRMVVLHVKDDREVNLQPISNIDFLRILNGIEHGANPSPLPSGITINKQQFTVLAEACAKRIFRWGWKRYVDYMNQWYSQVKGGDWHE